ncbi:MAG: hypothetical protein AB8B50_17715 [Pirellulaceae bacterium]
MNRTLGIVVLLVCGLAGNVFAQTTLQRSNDFKIRRIVQAAKPPPPIQRMDRAIITRTNFGGTFMEIDFKTEFDASAEVSLTSGAASSPVVVGKKILPMGRNHRVSFVNLKPNTRYVYRIDLFPDDSYTGIVRPSIIQFTTRERFVFVGVQTIHVFDDADATTAGDMSFRVQIGDEHGNFNEPGNSWDFLSFQAYLDSHTDLNVPASGKPYYLKSENVQSDTMKIAVSNYESDGFEFTGLGFSLGPDVYLGSGESSRAEWNSGFTTINIAGSFLSPDETTLQKSEALVKTFTIIVPPAQETNLSYSLTGQLVVAYY